MSVFQAPAVPVLNRCLCLKKNDCAEAGQREVSTLQGCSMSAVGCYAPVSRGMLLQKLYFYGLLSKVSVRHRMLMEEAYYP